MSNVDSNGNAPASGVTDDASETPTFLRVDPVTGYLVCIAVSSAISGNVSTRLATDANDNPIGMAVSETDPTAIRPLVCTAEGYLIVSQ